jgi:tetratricopeptide (TPR) repeat protein
MSALAVAGILIALLLAGLAFQALREGRGWLVAVEFGGFAAACLAVAMERRGTGSPALAFSAVAIVSTALAVNAVVLVYDFYAGRAARRMTLPRAGVFYRMIASEDELREGMSAAADEEINEGLQALELWRSGNESYLEGRFLDALSKYDLSGRWVPSVAAYVNASAVCIELGKYDDAIRYADLALAINEECPEAWQNRGLACDRLRRLGEALAAYRRVKHAEPQNSLLSLLLGRTLRRLGQLDEAERALDQGLEVDPNDPELLFEKSLVLIRKDRRDEALPYLEGAVRRNRKHYAAYFHLANTLNRMGKLEEALHYYNLVTGLRPEYPEAWNNRGIALSKLGKTRKATESYRKAIGLRPEYPEAWINLGLAYDSEGEVEKALEAYRRFLELAPASMSKHIELTRRRVEELQRQQTETEGGSAGSKSRLGKSRRSKSA